MNIPYFTRFIGTMNVSVYYLFKFQVEVVWHSIPIYWKLNGYGAHKYKEWSNMENEYIMMCNAEK